MQKKLDQRAAIRQPTPESVISGSSIGLCQDGCDDLEGVCAFEAGGIDGRAYVRFGLGGPHGAISVCHLSLNDAWTELSLRRVVGDVDLSWIVAKRQQLIAGPPDLGLERFGQVA